MSLLELFVEVDDFHQAFESWAASRQLPGKAKRGPEPSLSASEVMTIVIHFHQAGAEGKEDIVGWGVLVKGLLYGDGR